MRHGRMVLVRVRMLGTLMEASAKGEEELIFQGEVDVTGILQRIIDEHGDILTELLFDKVLQSPLPKALILFNGVEINNLEGLRTTVGDGDTLTLLPITHGG